MIEIDPELRTIKLLQKISSEEFYSLIKEKWIMSPLMSLHFPLKISDNDFCFINGWRFLDKESHNLVFPSILLGEMEEIPILPNAYVVYKNITFNSETTTLEELIRKLPPNIPNKSIHFKVHNNKIQMSIGGLWPNDKLEQEIIQYKKEKRRWLASYSYRKSLFSSDQS